MRVGVFCYEFPPQGGGGGTVMMELAKRLADFVDVEQTLIFGWDARFGNAVEIPGCSMRPVDVRRRSIHSTGPFAILQFIWRARLWSSSECDLLHFHFSIPTGVLRWVFRKRPYICSLHGIDVPYFISEEAVFLQRIVAPANRRILRDAACVVAPSKALAAMITAHVPEAKIVVVPHGVDVSRFVRKATYPIRARRFVSVSRLTKLKRVDHVICAVSALHARTPNVSLDVYGDGDQRAELESLISRLDAWSFIHLHGFIENSALGHILHEYDAFVLPSVTEAFGLVYLEAMACGLAVVAADYAGPAEIIDNDVEGLLIERDSLTALTDALLRLSNEPDLASRLGRNALIKALKCDWRNVAESYHAIYLSSIARSSGR